MSLQGNRIVNTNRFISASSRNTVMLTKVSISLLVQEYIRRFRIIKKCFCREPCTRTRAAFRAYWLAQRVLCVRYMNLCWSIFFYCHSIISPAHVRITEANCSASFFMQVLFRKTRHLDYTFILPSIFIKFCVSFRHESYFKNRSFYFYSAFIRTVYNIRTIFFIFSGR